MKKIIFAFFSSFFLIIFIWLVILSVVPKYEDLDDVHIDLAANVDKLINTHNISYTIVVNSFNDLWAYLNSPIGIIINNFTLNTDFFNRVGICLINLGNYFVAMSTAIFDFIQFPLVITS